jgi:two-component system nitrogen regulation sensor histidine kinase NtrY
VSETDGRKRHRRDNRLIAAVLLAVFLVWGGFYLAGESRHALASEALASRFTLFILWYLDVTLIAATLFVIFRALFKLLLDRRRRVLGAKFKTKLLVTHLGLTAIPIALLFLAATNLLQRAIDRWFSTPVETIVNRSEDLRDLADRRIWQGARREAHALARIVPPAASEASIRQILGRDLDLRSLDSVELYRNGRKVVAVSAGSDAPPPYPADELEGARRTGSSQTIDLRPDGSRWFRSAVSGPAGEIVVGFRVSRSEAAPADYIARAWSDYRKMEVQKSAIKATNILVFTLLTLALLFAAIWTGLTLAKRITAPIEALAESTRRIAQGDLTSRVEAPATDELGVLVDSFNAMTSEIRESRASLERSNRDLIATNQRLDRERELLAAILQAARTGIVALDRDGRVRLANPAALEILDLEQKPVMLDGLSERSDLAPLLAAVELARNGAESVAREFSPGREEPRRRAELSVSAMPGEGGSPRGFVVALEDTTEVAQAQRLQAWGEAARRVAHEIKNPLTPIKLSAERMIKKMNAGDPDSPEAVRQGAHVIIEEVDLLKRLVDQFSRFARMPESRPAPTDLSALAAHTLALYDGARDNVRSRSGAPSGTCWTTPSRPAKVEAP